MFRALYSAHTELLKKRRAEGKTTALWAAVLRFITEGKAIGEVLDNDSERETAQSMLDYWSTMLFLAERVKTDATLHEYQRSKLRKENER